DTRVGGGVTGALGGLLPAFGAEVGEGTALRRLSPPCPLLTPARPASDDAGADTLARAYV
ncbi:MAG: hypothetical protein ABFC80_06590, partial [Coriobacteriales bacterium]